MPDIINTAIAQMDQIWAGKSTAEKLVEVKAKVQNLIWTLEEVAGAIAAETDLLLTVPPEMQELFKPVLDTVTQFQAALQALPGTVIVRDWVPKEGE